MAVGRISVELGLSSAYLEWSKEKLAAGMAMTEPRSASIPALCERVRASSRSKTYADVCTLAL